MMRKRNRMTSFSLIGVRMERRVRGFWKWGWVKEGFVYGTIDVKSDDFFLVIGID